MVMQLYHELKVCSLLYGDLEWLCCMVQLYGLCTPIIYLSITAPEESKVFLFLKFLFLDTLYFKSHKKNFKWSFNCAMKYYDTKALYNITIQEHHMIKLLAKQ
jgi:hypothetical protein